MTAVQRNPAPATPHTGAEDVGTWDPLEDTEIELLTDDHEAVDVVDLADESWAPGQPTPGMPEDEVLHVHVLTEREQGAEELELDDTARDDLALAADELFEGETEQ